MNTKFYEFIQNNSGGHFDIDENVSHVVYIEATSKEEAKAKINNFTANENGSSQCCGDRWNRCKEIEGNLLYMPNQYVHVDRKYRKMATIHLLNGKKIYIETEQEA